MAWVYQLKPWVSIIATGLPAVGAALGGIKFTGEFRSTALRSTAMLGAIDDLEERYDAMLRGTKFKDARRLLANDDNGVPDALGDALTNAREKWELETTARNLRLIAEARAARGTGARLRTY
ncbi:MAG TPA: hypothetical protein VIF61_16180 [Methylocystis sp.]